MDMPKEAPAQEAQEQAQGGGVSELIINIDQGLTKLGAMMQNAQVPPEAVDMMAQANDLFRQSVQLITGGGKGPQKTPAGMGTADANAGGNKNAAPVM
jgi:hypothetical protein